MDLYNSRYFVINKIILSGTGLWPYQNRKKKILIRCSYITMVFFMAVPQFIGVHKHYGIDIDRFFEHLGVLCYTLVVFLKMLTSIVAENRLRSIYSDITENWKMINDETEKQQLLKHSQKGRLLTISYLAYIITALICFTALPVIPLVLNWMDPLNESRPHMFILNGEFIIDRDENYGKIYLFDAFVSAYTLIVLIAVDTMYVTTVTHCLGMFSILKYRLRQINKRIFYKEHVGLTGKDFSYEWIIQIVQLHNKILKFTVKLESTYSAVYLFTMGINLIYISIACVILVFNDQTITCIRYSMILIGQTTHLFYLSWPGQQIMDYSSSLLRDSYFNEWYECSEKSKTLLKVFALRCSKPCLLTAGGLYVLNFNNFLSIMKTSVSFITVLSSMR